MAGLLKDAMNEQAPAKKAGVSTSDVMGVVMLAGKALYGSAQDSVARFMSDGKISPEEAAALASEVTDAAIKQSGGQADIDDIANALPLIVLLVCELAEHVGGIQKGSSGKLARAVLPDAAAHFRETYMTGGAYGRTA